MQRRHEMNSDVSSFSTLKFKYLRDQTLHKTNARYYFFCSVFTRIGLIIEKKIINFLKNKKMFL